MSDNIQTLIAEGKIDTKKVAFIKVSIIAFIYACMWACILSDTFFIWLNKDLHLSETKIGTVMGCQALVAVLYKPLMGYMLDKFQVRITFISTIAIAGIFTGPFFTYIYQPLVMNPKTFYIGALSGGVLLGYMFVAGSAGMYSYLDKYVRAHGGKFSLPNAFIVAGLAVAGVAVPYMYLMNHLMSFYAISVFSAILLVALLTLKVKAFDNLETETSSRKKLDMSDMLNLLKRPHFYILALFAGLVVVIYYVQAVQIGLYALQIWVDTPNPTSAETQQAIQEMANVNAWVSPSQILVFAVILYSSRIIQAVTPKKSIVILGLIIALYMGGCGLAGELHSKVLIIGDKILFSVITPLIAVSVLAYVADSFNKKVTGVAFLIGFQFVNNLAYSGSSTLISHLFDVKGYMVGYYELAGVVLVGTLIIAILLSIFKTTTYKEELLGDYLVSN